MTAPGGAGWRGVEGAENRNRHRHHTALAGGFTYRYSAAASQGNMAYPQFQHGHICSHGELESFNLTKYPIKIQLKSQMGDVIKTLWLQTRSVFTLGKTLHG